MADSPPDKARATRLQRLQAMIDKKLDQAPAALEALLSELALGEPQEALWEGIHAAAARDQAGPALAAAYKNVTSPRRLQQLSPDAQAAVLMHAADCHQGVLGDAATAETYLERVLAIAPGHPEAFARFERRLEAKKDERRAVELYAHAAVSPPIPITSLAAKVVGRIVLLTDKQPVSDEACRLLALLAPHHPRLFQVAEAHCRLTKRPGVAAEMIELALGDPTLPEVVALEQRHRLLELWVEAGAPANAMPHVEALLERDAGNAAARKAAERLLSVREVASRAAAALQTARRNSQPPPSRSQPPPRG